MSNLALFSFILNNFQEVPLRTGVIFHCWENQVSKIFVEKASNQSFYAQLVNLKELNGELGNNFHHQYFKQERGIVGVFMDINCLKAEIILNKFSSFHLYNDHYHWILYDELSNILKFQKYFEHANVTVNSDVTYVQIDKNFSDLENNSFSKTYIQYDVYNNGPHIGGKLNMTIDRRIKCNTINCTLDQYLSNLYQRTKYGNRNCQSDINLRIGTVVTRIPQTTPEEEKLKFLLSNNNRNNDTLARFGFQQIALLKDMMNFNFDIHWNSQWSLNDTYGGNIGDLINEKVDIVSTAMSCSLDRRRLLTPLAESAIFRCICLFRTPLKTGLSNSGEVYLEPFDRNVWFIFGIIIIIGALELWIIFLIERKRLNRNTSEETPSFLASFLISFGTVCAQGSELLPSTIGGRLSYSVLILSSFIMYNYYTSIIVSTLLGTAPKSNIKTLEQLADSSLEVAFEPIAFNFVFMNVSTDPAVRRLIQRQLKTRKDPYSLYMPVEEGIQRVRDKRGLFAYEFEATSSYSIVEKYYKPDEICDLNEILFRPETYLVNLAHRNSSFVDIFRLRFLRLLETGINRRNIRYWMRDRLFCFPSITVETVSLGHTAPLFFLLLIAFLIAVLTLGLERICHNYKKT